MDMDKKELLLRYELSFAYTHQDGPGLLPRNGRAEYQYRMASGRKEDAIGGMLGKYSLSVAKAVPSYSDTGKPALQALLYDTEQHKTVLVGFIADEKTVDKMVHGEIPYEDFINLVVKGLAKAPGIDTVISSFKEPRLLNEEHVYRKKLMDLEECLKQVYQVGRNLETTNKDIQQMMQMFTKARRMEQNPDRTR